MPLRHWTESEVPEAKLRDHNLRAHESLSRAHVAWFWLVGPGSSSLLGPQFFEGSRHWDVNRERQQAARDCRTQAWTADTLRSVHQFVERLRARSKAPQPTQQARPSRSRARRDIDLDGSDNVQQALSQSDLGPGRILPTVDRDWPETFHMSDEQRAEAWRRVMRAWSPRGAPPPERNDRDHDQPRERMSQVQAQVLFAGDDQGNDPRPNNPEPETEEEKWF
jgi:hypothetical protein